MLNFFLIFISTLIFLQNNQLDFFYQNLIPIFFTFEEENNTKKSSVSCIGILISQTRHMVPILLTTLGYQICRTKKLLSWFVRSRSQSTVWNLQKGSQQWKMRFCSLDRKFWWPKLSRRLQKCWIWTLFKTILVHNYRLNFFRQNLIPQFSTSTLVFYKGLFNFFVGSKPFKLKSVKNVLVLAFLEIKTMVFSFLLFQIFPWKT